MPRKKMKLTADELGRELLLYIVGIVRQARDSSYTLRYTLEEIEEILHRYIVTDSEKRIYNRYADAYTELYDTGVYFDELKDRARANQYFIETRLGVCYTYMGTMQKVIEYLPDEVVKEYFEKMGDVFREAVTDYLGTKRKQLVNTLYLINLLEPLIKATADYYKMPELNEMYTSVVGGFAEETQKHFNKIVTDFEKLYLDDFMEHPFAPAIDPLYKVWLAPIEDTEIKGTDLINDFLYKTLYQHYTTNAPLYPKYLRRLMYLTATGRLKPNEQ